MMSETLSGSHEKLALPTPSRIPATGKTETGNIMHLPIFCRREKALLKLSILIFRFRNQRAHFFDGGAVERALGEVATGRQVEPANLGFDGGDGGKAHTELVNAETEKERDRLVIAGHAAANPGMALMGMGALDSLRDQPQHGGIQGIDFRRELRMAA